MNIFRLLKKQEPKNPVITQHPPLLIAIPGPKRPIPATAAAIARKTALFCQYLGSLWTLVRSFLDSIINLRNSLPTSTV